MRNIIITATLLLTACEFKLTTEHKSTSTDSSEAQQTTIIEDEKPKFITSQKEIFDDLTKIKNDTGWVIQTIWSSTSSPILGQGQYRSGNFYQVPDFTDNYCGITIELPNKASEGNIKISGTPLRNDCPELGYYKCEITFSSYQSTNPKQKARWDYIIHLKHCAPNQGQTKYFTFLTLGKPNMD